MAVAVSNFYPSHISLENLIPSQPAPSARLEETFGHALTRLSTYAHSFYDDSQAERKASQPGPDETKESTCSLHASHEFHNDTSRQELRRQLREEGPADVAANKSASPAQLPFQKWMDSLQKRNRRSTRERDQQRNRWISSKFWDKDRLTEDSLSISFAARKSMSGSSFKFVSAVRSLSYSLVTSVANETLSDKKSHQTEWVGAEPEAPPRACYDNEAAGESLLAGGEAQRRALKRRKIFEELINTEQSYTEDLRLLLNVYVTMLASTPSPYVGLRQSVNRNLCEILQLHEEILSQLRSRVCLATPIDLCPHQTPTTTNSTLFTSGQEEVFRRSACNEDQHESQVTYPPDLLTEPQILADVSKIFERKMSRFFVYKEYMAKFEMMVQDTEFIGETLPGWELNQKGIEIFSEFLSLPRREGNSSRRASTLKDLLVKPVQRICKYPLIFAELLKCTPESDCANAHMAASSVLNRFQEANAEINGVTGNAQMKSTLSRTWLLQDRLMFPNRNFDSVSRDRVRSFGHIRLCGTLHICWQNEHGVDGKYLICLLYHDVLCLADAGRVDPMYTIKACINVHELRMDDPDNGRGLQCHTAPFSWKLIFESHHELFEIIMTACSSKEEVEWRAHLSSPPLRHYPEDSSIFTFLDLGIRSLGTVTGKTGAVARRVSMRRATTISPKPALHQVILKNTSGAGRKRSEFAERARLEAQLEDVWSHEVLPYLGGAGRSRSERLVRSSASSVIRKLSVASIASSWAKRTEGLRQRLSLDEPSRPMMAEKTFETAAETVSAATARSSWPQKTMTDLLKTTPEAFHKGEIKTAGVKKFARSSYGLRGIFT